MTHPIYTPAEQRTRETFLALMWALSYPGRVQTLPQFGAPFTLIAETLLDLETSYYSPDSALAATCAQTGARDLLPSDAAYHFFPALSADTLPLIQQARVGTMAFPDTSATLIVGCTLGAGQAYSLRGPGIAGEIQLRIAGLPEEFWDLRTSACRFPLGWDVFLVDDYKLLGLPRSTKIESVG